MPEAPEAILADVARCLRDRGVDFALVGGLAVSERRLQDRLDAINLLLTNPSLGLADVRDLLDRITKRGFDRGQDLGRKLDALLVDVREQM